MDIIFATKNKGKIKEIQAIMEGTDFHVLSMEEVGIDIEVVEDGETFEENAIKKAVEIMEATGKIVLSDDSGLEIDYLDKAPGVYSARFLGEDTPYAEKNRQVLDMLKDVPQNKRTARFVSVIAAAIPMKNDEPPVVLTERGTVEGIIHDRIAGQNGFGYDPIFFLPEYGITTAEMSMEEKNKISHRGKALAQMKITLQNWYDNNCKK